eukprot:1118670_1
MNPFGGLNDDSDAELPEILGADDDESFNSDEDDDLFVLEQLAWEPTRTQGKLVAIAVGRDTIIVGTDKRLVILLRVDRDPQLLVVGKKEDLIHALFVDEEANHLIVTMKNGLNFYINLTSSHASSRRKQTQTALSKVKGITIESMYWNKSSFRDSTGLCLCGTSNGCIYSLQISEGKERIFSKLYDFKSGSYGSGTSTMDSINHSESTCFRVCGLHVEQLNTASLEMDHAEEEKKDVAAEVDQQIAALKSLGFVDEAIIGKKKNKKKKKHKKHSHDHNDKTWTQHEHDTLMDLTRQYNTLDDVPIKTLSQIKSTLHKEMNEIKSYFTAQKDNDKSMASWAQWEENYLISFVEQRRILDTFSEPQANEIKHVLNRPMDDIYACVDRLKREEKIKNTEAHAKQSPLFQYLLDNKTETCEETSDPKHSNIPALQLVQSAVDKEVIEEVNHAQIPSVMIVHNDDNTDHEIEAVNNGQTIETPDALERKHMETNGEMVVCDAMPDLIRSDHDKDVDMSASNKNERKRKFSEMMGEDEECNTNANEKELEILSLSLSLKNEFKKGIHLVGNMRVPSEDNDQNNYINLLTTQLERIQQCNYEMYEYQNKNSRATLGDIIRARNSRGHIRQKQQQ